MGRNLNFTADRRGAAIVEFAILLPVLILIMLGMLSYGQYFLLAHSIQQLANDAARATVAGVTPAERLTIAGATVTREKASLPEAASAAITTAVDEATEKVTVRVRLDASNTPLFRNTIVPLPDAVIERRAVVRPGGIA
jgi:Flp pilus assembly protein TadG